MSKDKRTQRVAEIARRHHVEELYALVKDDAIDGRACTAMVYALQPSAAELWYHVVELELMGTGHTRATLEALGWRARRVLVSEL
jgi:hypothetical protein